MVAHVAKKRTNACTLRAWISEMMGFVDHQQVDDAAAASPFLEKACQAGSRRADGWVLVPPEPANSLNTADESLGLQGSILGSTQFLQEPFGVHLAGGDAELVFELKFPFVAQRSGAHNYKSAGVGPCAEFCPNQSGLNRLAQSNLVGNQDAIRRRCQKPQHGRVLVGQKVNVRRVHAVHQIVHVAGDLTESDVPAKLRGSAETSLLQEVEGVGWGFGSRTQRGFRAPAVPSVVPLHVPHTVLGPIQPSETRSASDHASATRVVLVLDR